ncbi:uncharacterized protein BCR38DRAFT_351976 [Pseudomassariella vexata]|uniref:Zn(2)-C6 fungal-type domain-containing protein n=1 Tax=Pseudomassariella vexata TaxID=1141098 RepID=A0A1Y2DJ73_9PEZI|nr:uncharacterized protein BCR38DRAFT_351976 [Pseudomassariella vexata]ORY59303.1 hypothetical protein BCR38DRAFT_351976 [Pseudomassariella vexata]
MSNRNNPPQRTTHPPIRSCTFCRQRKIKCDRQKPCSNCDRGGRGLECVYPPGPGRSAKRPRQPIDPTKVFNRLDRLESMINRLGTQNSSLPLEAADEDLLSPAEKPPSVIDGADQPNKIQPNIIDQQLGRLVIDDTRSYYVSNLSWASLGNEVEELRNLLAEPTSEEGDYPLEYNATPSSFDPDASILGFGPVSNTLQRYHPLPSEAIILLQVFKENVAPVVRTLHMPTTERIYQDAIAALDSLDRNVEALMFAIYYSAVISMPPQQCTTILGMSRESLLERYRFAVKQALARANLLKTESIIVLQAAVLFIESVRNEDDSRTVWSLTSLIVHIAKAMGLHRDGAAFGLKPFETELRRRLWYHICLLDIRSSEYHGYEPIVNGCGFDTKLPLHINDSDLTPEMASPPPEREEACEMTLCLIRSDYMRLGWKVNFAPPSIVSPDGATNAGLSRNDGHMLVERFETRLQQRYLCHCDTDEPFMFLTSAIARLMIARSRISVHKTVHRNSASNSTEHDSDTRDYLFQKSIEVLEVSSLLLTSKHLTKWTWHTKTHVQWHAVAFVLSEICSRPAGPDCDRAWGYACTLFDEWKVKDNARRGSLWRPIKRLLAKARYVRELQTVSGLHDKHYDSQSAATLMQEFEGSPEDLDSASTNWESSSSTNDMFDAFAANGTPNISGMGYLDPLVAPFSDPMWLNNYEF